MTGRSMAFNNLIRKNFMGWDLQYIKSEMLSGHKYCTSLISDINNMYRNNDNNNNNIPGLSPYTKEG